MYPLLRHLFLFSLLVQVSFQDEDHGCENVNLKPEYKLAHAGWPMFLSCALFDHNSFIYTSYIQSDSGDYYSGYYEEVEESTELLCQIMRSNGTLLLNKTIVEGNDFYLSETSVIPDPQSKESNEFRLKLLSLSSNDCWTIDITLNLTDRPTEICGDYLQSKPTYKFKSKVDDRKVFQCEGFTDVFPKIGDRDLYKDLYSYQWRHNCSETLPDGVEVNENNALVVKSVDFEQAGLYTCSVTYNGMVRYIYYTEVCVHHPVTFTQHTLTCSQDVFENENEEAVFNCIGNFGEGQVEDSSVSFFWQKKGSDTRTDCDTADDASEQKHCTYTLDEVCYLYNPADTDKQKLKAIVPIRFSIRNISKSDYGEYVISAATNTQESKVANDTVELRRKIVPGLESTASIIGICCGALFIVLILMILIIYNLIYLKVLYKIYFGKYELDDKDYGAFLVYNYGLDNDTFSAVDVKTSVTAVSDILKEMGYRIFIEEKNYSNEYVANFVQNSIARSHRVIVFLTTEFIKDGWSMFKFYKGFNEMIQSGSKLIFILLPGMKEYLKQHQHDDLTCQAIQSAIRTNYSIAWTGERCATQKRFSFAIEAAMPKLRSRKLSLATISSSEGFSSFELERSLSKETYVSERYFQDEKC